MNAKNFNIFILVVSELSDTIDCVYCVFVVAVELGGKEVCGCPNRLTI